MELWLLVYIERKCPRDGVANQKFTKWSVGHVRCSLCHLPGAVPNQGPRNRKRARGDSKPHLRNHVRSPHCSVQELYLCLSHIAFLLAFTLHIRTYSSHRAPIIALYADLTTSVPIYVSGAIFIAAGFIALLIPFEPRGRASL